MNGVRAEDMALGRFIRAAVTGDGSRCPLEKRALSEGVNMAGGFLVPGILSARLIDRARKRSGLGWRPLAARMTVDGCAVNWRLLIKWHRREVAPNKWRDGEVREALERIIEDG